MRDENTVLVRSDDTATQPIMSRDLYAVRDPDIETKRAARI